MGKPVAVESIIRPSRLFTVEHSVVLYTAARVKPAKLREVRDAIQKLFA
jgi:hypothetical protein